jgi:hypothetical protein
LAVAAANFLSVPHLELCLPKMRPHRRVRGQQVVWGAVAGSCPPWLACHLLLLMGRQGGGRRDVPAWAQPADTFYHREKERR